MNILQIGILVFVLIETLNVLTLYFNPNFKYGNGIGVFNDYQELKDSKHSEFIHYLINWVAGAKLIFIMIGIVVVIVGNEQTQLFTCIALIMSILSFYYKLFPAIKRLDKKGGIDPKGYSKTLNYMILSFIIGFLVIVLISIIS